MSKVEYRLIKKLPYPTSYGIGDIIITDDGKYRDILSGLYINLSKFPEYWEKVIQKDYEILKVSYNNKVYDRFDGTYWFDEKAIIIKNDIASRVHINSLKSSEANIHSVKRLSDGVTFSIGDRIESDVNKMSCRVEEILLDKAGFIKLVHNKGWIQLSVSVKLESLFVTADDINLFHGSKFYYVDNSWNIIEYVADENKSWKYQYQFKDKIFSTEPAAQDYIIKNKPCLSFKMLKNWGLFELQFPIEESSLLDFIKTKCNE